MVIQPRSLKTNKAAQLRAQQRLGINLTVAVLNQWRVNQVLHRHWGQQEISLTNREAERRNAAQQTWDRRAYVNNLGINQMNMAAQGVDNANNQLMNNYNNAAAQKLNKQARFGAAGAIGGQYLSGLSAAQSPNIQTSGIPTRNVSPYQMPTPRANTFVDGITGSNSP